MVLPHRIWGRTQVKTKIDATTDTLERKHKTIP